MFYTKLYKKQKGLCFVCKNSFKDQELFKNKTYIHHVVPISKEGGSNSEKILL
jgi:hypothetical protein